MTSKEENWRNQGAVWALNRALEIGLDETLKEMKWRGIHAIPCGVNKKDVENAMYEIGKNAVIRAYTVILLAVRDSEGFGHKRLLRVLDNAGLKAECLTNDYSDWKMYKDILLEECNIDIEAELMKMEARMGDKEPEDY